MQRSVNSNCPARGFLVEIKGFARVGTKLLRHVEVDGVIPRPE